MLLHIHEDWLLPGITPVSSLEISVSRWRSDELDGSQAKKLDPILDDLISLFYDDSDSLGEFELVLPRECPKIYQELLDHSAHMTVTVERHHGDKVDVEVLSESWSGDHYQRKILLRRHSDRQIVQFGIVRVALAKLPSTVRTEVIEGSTPLGRVLIEHDVLREVHLINVWKVRCGSDLARNFSVDQGEVTYGRTARILVESEPAIELLEIVAPEA